MCVNLFSVVVKIGTDYVIGILLNRMFAGDSTVTSAQEP